MPDFSVDFKVGDKVKIVSPYWEEIPAVYGEIIGTYLYNSFDSQTQETGYRVLINGQKITFDFPDFVKVK